MANAPTEVMDPIHQFELVRKWNFEAFGLDLVFTNVSFYMVVVTVFISALMMLGTYKMRPVPQGHLQVMVELLYEMVDSMVRSMVGEAGMKFFPFVFSLFTFVLFSNMIGLIPHAFTVTSQIVVTFTLASLVIGTVIVYGFVAHGWKFLRLFAPSGVSPFLLPFLVIMEIISFLSRPISLAVRLFANMLAGHITLKVFAGFAALLTGAGGWALLMPLPFVGTLLVTAFEILVAFLQAYIFAILTCIYLNDAVHPGH